VRGPVRESERVESPPHPNPLPASGARERNRILPRKVQRRACKHVHVGEAVGAAGNLLRLARAAKRNAPAYCNQRTRPGVDPVMSRCSPSGMNKPMAHRQKFAQLSRLTRGREALLSWQVFIVTIILILLCASASAGLAIGLLLFRVEAIVLASLCLALLCAVLLPYHGFGLGGDVLISVGLLAALQSFFFVGTVMSCLVMDD
jgi:hypothetical protein